MTRDTTPTDYHELPRPELGDQWAGDWDQLVADLDQNVILSGPIADRPAASDAPDHVRYQATDQDLIYRLDPSNGWVVTGHGTADTPVPESHVESLSTKELSGEFDVLVDDAGDLSNLDTVISSGKTVRVARPDTPYRTTDWIDYIWSGGALEFESLWARELDANGNPQPIVKVADGANVGGVRIPSSANPSEVEIRNFGYHGNAANQDQSVGHLDAVKPLSGDEIIVDGVYSTRPSPHHEVLSNPDDAHNFGGSAVSVDGVASFTLKNIRSHDTGDRAVEVYAGEGKIEGVKSTAGFDRTVSVEADAKNVDVRHIRARDNVQGSVIGVGHPANPADEVRIRDVVARGQHRTLLRVDSQGNPSGTVTLSDFDGYQTTTDADNSGVFAEAGSSDVIVDDGRLRGYAGDGVRFEGTGCYAKEVDIRDVGRHGIADIGGGNRYRECAVRGYGDGVGGFGVNAAATGSLFHENEFYNNPNAGAPVHESGDDNTWRNNWTDLGWDLPNQDGINGPSSSVVGHEPAFDKHRNLAPSGGSYTLTFDKPYAAKPLINVTVQSSNPIIWSAVYNDSDSDGNFESATIYFTDDDGTAVNPTFHATVDSETV